MSKNNENNNWDFSKLDNYECHHQLRFNNKCEIVDETSNTVVLSGDATIDAMFIGAESEVFEQ